MIRVVVAGAAGKMGRQVVEAVLSQEDMALVGAVDVAAAGRPLRDLGPFESDLTVSEDLREVLGQANAEVMVDFTHPSAVMRNIRAALGSRVSPVVGTTGLSDEDLEEIRVLAQEHSTPAFVAPNFAVGAVLMMEFAKRAARYFPNVEVIELHHAGKADSPSGTSLKTAKDIAAAVEEIHSGPAGESLKGARGADVAGIRVHSVRLPGLVAHQEVIFGGKGQTLTIRHDSIDRTSFMPGVLLAIRAVGSTSGLTYGLENLLEV